MRKKCELFSGDSIVLYYIFIALAEVSIETLLSYDLVVSTMDEDSDENDENSNENDEDPMANKPCEFFFKYIDMVSQYNQ